MNFTGHLHIHRTDAAHMPAHQVVCIGMPAWLHLTVLAIRDEDCDIRIDGAGSRASLLINLIRGDAVDIHGIELRMVSVTQRKNRWVELRIAADRSVPIWRGELYDQVLAEHLAGITTRRLAA